MWEEIEAECLRTIERGQVDETIRLSRRHRWKPLALDVHGDVAVVVVARRGKRAGGSIQGIPFHRRADEWVCVGSPGVVAGSADDRFLPPRGPGCGGVQWSSGGGTRLVSTPWWSFGRRFVSHRVFQVPEGVSHLEAHGRRAEVSAHGFGCVVGRGRRMPAVTLLDAEGRPLERLTARSSSLRRGMPWSARLHRWLTAPSHRSEWFNYAPRRR